MEKRDIEYEFAAKKIFDNLRDLVSRYLILFELGHEKDFQRLEYILPNIYLNITNNKKASEINQLSNIEKLITKNIDRTINSYCNNQEKTQKISDYYKLVIQYFIKQQLEEDLSSSLTNVYNKILEIDKENLYNKNNNYNTNNQKENETTRPTRSNSGHSSGTDRSI